MKTSLIKHLQAQLAQARQSFTLLKKHRPEPAWARLLISGAIGLAFACLFTLVPGLLTGHLLDGAWLLKTFQANLIISLCVSYLIHLMFRSLELLLPEPILARMQAWHGTWRGGVFASTVAISGTILGFVLGMLLVGRVFKVDALGEILNSPPNLRLFAFLTLLITLANLLWWKVHSKQQALQLAATEARLSLLQAQIEPHFLFNTLANVQSLIDLDAPRAKQMLEAFTDYLRISLGQLRRADGSVGAELEMAQSYLQLLQIRMGERLSFTIAADAQARAAVLPPLLLQPLIENAVHHGLEPKVEGGHIRVSARVEQGRLLLSVEDDGLGLDGPRRPGRKGAGMALENIRARLLSRYPHNAELSLHALQPGTSAGLNLPYIVGRETAAS
ncbi:MAG: histidine kinase [Paucibacter sp.]|nr:histidine kinase [Roseateles sp.]